MIHYKEIDVYDKVWTMECNRPEEMIVDKIVKKSSDLIEEGGIHWYVELVYKDPSKGYVKRTKSRIFWTKEKLIESLYEDD